MVTFSEKLPVPILLIHVLALLAAAFLLPAVKQVCGIAVKAVLKFTVNTILLLLFPAPTVSVTVHAVSVPVTIAEPAPAPGPRHGRARSARRRRSGGCRGRPRAPAPRSARRP